LQAVLANRLNDLGAVRGVGANLPGACLGRGDGLLRLSVGQQGFDFGHTICGGLGILIGTVDGRLMYLGDAPSGDASVYCVFDRADGTAACVQDVAGRSTAGAEKGLDPFHGRVLVEQFRQTGLALIAQGLQAVGGVLVDLFDAGLGGGVGRFGLSLLEELRDLADTGGGDGARLFYASQGNLSKGFGAWRRWFGGIVEGLGLIELVGVGGDIGEGDFGEVLGLEGRLGVGRLARQGGGGERLVAGDPPGQTREGQQGDAQRGDSRCSREM